MTTEKQLFDIKNNSTRNTELLQKIVILLNSILDQITELNSCMKKESSQQIKESNLRQKLIKKQIINESLKNTSKETKDIIQKVFTEKM